MLVLKAVFGLAQRAATGVAFWILAAAAFGAFTFTSAPFPLVIAAAGALGFALFPRASEDTSATSGRWTQSVRVLGFGALLIAGSLLVVRTVFPDVFDDIARLFSTAAFVSFGGAYAILPFVAENAVEQEGWLTAAEMLNGLALGEATPGPLILVNPYAGFFGEWSACGVWAGVLGAVLACYFTFLPSFVLVFAIAPHVESLGGVPWALAALAGVSAAVIGAIAHLAVYLGQAAFFPEGLSGDVEWPKLALFLAFGAAMAWRPLGLLGLIGGGAAAGLVLGAAGFA